MVRTYEAPWSTPWSFDLPADYMSRMMNGIVGLRDSAYPPGGEAEAGPEPFPADQQAVVEALMPAG